MALAASFPLPAVVTDPWIFVTVDPARAHAGVPIGSDYVERYWTPTLGPSTVALLRLLARDLDAWAGNGHRVDLTDLATRLGLGAGVTRSSPIARTMNRLAQFGFGCWHLCGTDRALEVFAHAWPISPTRLRRLPADLHDAHTASLAAARGEMAR